jgi:energy-coupling factor transporter ATP-binding protein EcfA2
MLRRVTLRFGASETHPGLSFTPGPMTVFVGPNNSGKSLALREIEHFLENGGEGERRIVEHVEPQLPPPAEGARMLRSRQMADDAAVPTPAGWVRVSRMKSLSEQARKRATDVAEPPPELLVNLESVMAALANGESLSRDEFALLCREFLILFTIRLDGQTRLALTQPRLAGDLQRHPANHLAALFRDDEARERIREITADALGLYFVIDPTGVTHFRIRMSDRAPHDPAEEQALDARAQAFHGRAPDIAEMSDGVRAFTGLTAAVLSADHRIMLVDEPEAFLHPPLTRKLGRRLTELASVRGANVLASTHSPDFVMGCIQAGKSVNIVRLTYRRGVPSARLLAASELRTMMRDPLLRSTGVLGALFHEGAIVCEADADRVFYQEINERLLAARAGGADGCIFLNAQNKQTIRRIVRPLREMGIPAAAVADLDVLKGRDDFRDLIRAAFVPRIFWEPWEEVRSRLHQKLRNEEFKDGGIYSLSRDLRAQARMLLDNLASYGVFLVPSGELESWLPELEVGGHGPEWLTQVFDRMGTDPTSDTYRHPSEGGVWRFMQGVAAWIADPHRHGMAEETIPLDHLLPPPPEDEPGEAPSASSEEGIPAVAAPEPPATEGAETAAA